MAISDIKKGFGGGTREKPGKDSAPPPEKEEKKDTSIFGGKSALGMGEARWKIRKSSPSIPGTSGEMYSEEERAEIAKELSKKYGNYLERDERYRIYGSLNKEKTQAKTNAERIKVDRKIRYLKGLLGD